MNCISYVYDKVADYYFCDELFFSDFEAMSHYFSICEQFGYIIQCIVDKDTNEIYFYDLPEGTIVCMMISKN